MKTELFICISLGLTPFNSCFEVCCVYECVVGKFTFQRRCPKTELCLTAEQKWPRLHLNVLEKIFCSVWVQEKVPADEGHYRHSDCYQKGFLSLKSLHWLNIYRLLHTSLIMGLDIRATCKHRYIQHYIKVSSKKNQPVFPLCVCSLFHLVSGEISVLSSASTLFTDQESWIAEATKWFS